MLVYILQKYSVMLVSSFIGTLGFCLFFHMKKNKLLYGCIGGTLSICVYFMAKESGMNIFFQNLTAAIVATLYAEIFARIAKAPSTVFLIASIIPLTPGSLLYYTMEAAVIGDEALTKQMAEDTLMVALGIAFGIVLVSAMFNQFTRKSMPIKVKPTRR